MTEHVDVAVIGAGPAGMAAAAWLSGRGVATLVLDEQAEPGGQIYRAVERVAEGDPVRLAALGSEYEHGHALTQSFRASGCEYWPGATVWQITQQRDVWISRDGRSRKVRAERVILATGAMERPVPVPGWTLPGVMTVGALQILLKSSGIAVDDGLVLLGSGPLLLQFAVQCLALGIVPAAIIETTTRANHLNAVPFLPAALAGHGLSYLRKGLSLKALLRRSGIATFAACTDIRIDGAETVRSVSFRSGGRDRTIAASMVAVHEGVIPVQQLARQVGCRHVWDARQQCFRPELDAWGNSSVPGIAVAGDGAGIGGARAAEHAGRIVAAEAARALGRVSQAERDSLTADDRRELAGHLAVRPFLDTLYAPPSTVSGPPDDILVCRCEEVSAGTVRTAAAGRDFDPNSLKRLLRCGMGPCQGRICGPVVSRLVAEARGCAIDDVGYYNIRPPLKPLPLEEIAAIDGEGYSG